MLHGPDQSPVGVKPESRQPNQDRNQKSNEQNLSPAQVPEEKSNRRNDGHQDRIDDRYPGDRVFVHDRTMIKPDLDQDDAKTQ